MADVDFPDDFCRFLQTSVPAVEVAEVLLFLRRHPGLDHSASAIAAGLRPGTSLSEAEAEKLVDGLRAQELVALDAGNRARYAPATEALAHHVEQLATAYAERPVTLIRVIYALRDSKIKTFADAFRIKR